MSEAAGYLDWRSVESAIKDAAKTAAREAGPNGGAATVDAHIRQARFDRFLSRVFAAGEHSEWLLKGGMSILARVPRARATKDMDLASQAPNLAEAGRALTELVDVNLGDHLTFRLIRSTPTGLGHNQPGLAARRYVFACIDVDHDTQIDTVRVDVVVGPPPVGQPEIIEPANRLHLRRPLITHPYRLYPVADQIADKVCATMDTTYPGGKRSSRVKDLVDLVILANTQTVDLNELRTAIATKRIISGIEQFRHFEIPTDWTWTYAPTSQGVLSAESLTADAAADLIVTFVDPSLTTTATTAIWDPARLTWVTAATIHSETPSDA